MQNHGNMATNNNLTVFSVTIGISYSTGPVHIEYDQGARYGKSEDLEKVLWMALEDQCQILQLKENNHKTEKQWNNISLLI